MADYDKPEAKGCGCCGTKYVKMQVAWHCNPDAAVTEMPRKVDELVVHLGEDGKVKVSEASK